MTDEQLTEIIVHPRFRAAVERQVRQMLIDLGLAKPVPPILTDEEGNPLPEHLQVPALLAADPQEATPAPRATRTTDPEAPKLTTKQRHALEQGWVSAAVVQELIQRSGAMISRYVSMGLLERAAHGYYTKESYERTRAWIEQCGAATEGNLQKLRDAVDRRMKQQPTEEGYITVRESATLYNKAYHTMRAIVVENRIDHKRMRGVMGGSLLLVNADALAAYMRTHKGRQRKASAPATTKGQAPQPEAHSPAPSAPLRESAPAASASEHPGPSVSISGSPQQAPQPEAHSSAPSPPLRESAPAASASEHPGPSVSISGSPQQAPQPEAHSPAPSAPLRESAPGASASEQPAAHATTIEVLPAYVLAYEKRISLRKTKQLLHEAGVQPVVWNTNAYPAAEARNALGINPRKR